MLSVLSVLRSHIRVPCAFRVWKGWTVVLRQGRVRVQKQGCDMQ